MRRFLLIISFFLLAECATTDMSSQTDISFQGGLRSVIVYGDMGIEERKVIETTIVNEFIKEGIIAMRSLDYLPISFTNEQFGKLLWGSGADSVLIIFPGDKRTNTRYFPGQTTSTTTGTIRTFGNTATYRGKTTYNTTPGYVLSFPNAGYSAFLVYGQGIVWRASAFSSGNAYADYKDLAKSMARKTVKQLIKDGIYISITPEQALDEFIDSILDKNEELPEN